MKPSRPVALLYPAIALVLLGGCGQMPGSSPSTAPAIAPTTEQSITTPASAETTGIATLGDLVARVDAAWPAVESYHAVFTSTVAAVPAPPSTPVATPVATPGATPIARTRGTFTFVRDVVLPDQQRQEVTGIGANDHQAIATGGRLFMRGPLTAQIAPGTPAGAWLEVDAAQVPAGSVLSLLLGGLPQSPAAPLATVPERLFSQELRDLGQVEFDGRTCQVYGAADTVAATGMRVDYAIAIDERDIPCYIETSAGGAVQGRDEFRDIGSAIEIVAPRDATPVSVPPALATPAVHD